MNDLIERVENARLDAALTQAALARLLGISQPHYSKVAGGLVKPSPDLVDRVQAWLGSQSVNPLSTDGQAAESYASILKLTRSIEKQTRQLTQLLSSGGLTPPRRGIRRAARRSE